CRIDGRSGASDHPRPAALEGRRRARMAFRGLRSLALVALLLAWSAAATASPVAADGIPSPVPGASVGPSGDALRAIATSLGLTCQDDPAGGASEAFCNDGGSQSYAQSATFTTRPALVLVASATGTAPLSDRALP